MGKKKAPRKNNQNSTSENKRSVEIDLHGLTVAEALATLEKTIDRALLNNTSQISVIHGLGTGKVKAAVQQYLKNSKYIETSLQHPSNPGVTIAYL